MLTSCKLLISLISPAILESTNTCIVLSFLSFTIALALTPPIRNITLAYNRVDLPSHRKLHQRPVARTGGVAIFAATISVLVAVGVAGGLSTLSAEMVNRFWAVLLGGLCFFCVGLADDLNELSPFLRLCMQFAIACAVWMAGVRIESLSLPLVETVHFGWVSLPITVIWLTGVVNAINWIDGLDGLAAGVGGIAAAIGSVIYLHAEQVTSAIVCLVLLGSLLGFLVFNFNPARIFMGDSGSYFIGFLLAAVSIAGLDSEAETVGLLLPGLLLAVPLLDMCLVILARLYRGVSPFIADNRHLHYRLLQAGLTHRFTVLFIYVLTLWAGSLALLCGEVPGSLFVIAGATSLLGILVHKATYAVRQDAFTS